MIRAASRGPGHRTHHQKCLAGEAAYLLVVTIESLTHRYFATPPRGIDEVSFRQGLKRLILAYLREPEASIANRDLR